MIEKLRLIEALASVFEARFMKPNYEDHLCLETDPWQALAFFAGSYAFERQGRSPNFAPAAVDVLVEFGKDDESLENPQIAQHIWKRFCKCLSGLGLNERNNPLCPRGTWYANKHGRRQTRQLSAIECVQGLSDHNLVVWAKHELAGDNAKGAHKALVKINGVGGKIVSLFLRDIAWIFNVVPMKDRELLQPIDIWIRRVVAELADKESPSDDIERAHWIVRASKEGGVSPEKVNAGMWYLGAQIAGSQYMLKRLLADPTKLLDGIGQHVWTLENAAKAWR